jgi:hypothetical protein
MMDLDVTHRFVPSAINDATVIAGSFFESPGGSRAAVWRNGSFLELTSKDSGASDLNDAGQIAGYIADGTGEQIATMWTPTRCEH